MTERSRTAPGPRILSIRQPFAWAILAGRKKVKNRSWDTPYRGTVYLHAGKGYDREGREWMTEVLRIRVPKDLPTGAIVGACELRAASCELRAASCEGS